MHADRALRDANLQAAEAVLENARINLGHTCITATVASRTGSCKIRVGELVEVGTQIVTLVPDAVPSVIANYKEKQFTNMHPGQKAEVYVDAFPGQTLKGYVATISPTTGAAFSLLPNDNTSENFTKVVNVFRYGPSKVRRGALISMAYQLAINGLLGFKKKVLATWLRDYAGAAIEALDSKWARQTPARVKRTAEKIRTGK